MANQKTERMDKEVRAEVLRILREQVNDPSRGLVFTMGMPNAERVAGNLLRNAGLLTEHGSITLAGMDYFRKETANPIRTWIRANWFAAIVAGCTIGVSVFGIVSG